MYKIFFNEDVIFIEDKKTLPDSIELTDKQEFISYVRRFLADENRGDIRFFHARPEQVLAWLKEELQYIEAAGGLVKNRDEEFLFIHRRGFWDLPKGKIEEGEVPKEAAYREIQEECGISTHRNTGDLACSYHIYEQEGLFYLKKTFWYRFEMETDEDDLQPQTEEDIEQAVWLEEAEVDLALLEAYASIRDLWEKFKN